MGRKPNQASNKEYLENPRTNFRFSDAADFREVFPASGTNNLYLKPATGGKRLGKGSFRIVAHLPNEFHDDRDEYIAKQKAGKKMDRFLEGGTLPATRLRWDVPTKNTGAHLILHTQKGKRVEFLLQGLGSKNLKGSLVFASAIFPSEKTRKLVHCLVLVGFFGQSKSKPGDFKLTFSKPQIQCTPGLATDGHVPASFLKPKKGVKAAEGEGFVLSAETLAYFNQLTGQTQEVQTMNSETSQQSIERAYYNPSDAMVGTDETLDGYRPIDSATVDLTSNQPTANYGAENQDTTDCRECGAGMTHTGEYVPCMCKKSESATYAPSQEPDMVESSDFTEPTNSQFSADCSCVSCASCMAAESFYAESEPIAVAEGTSLNGYTPIDSLEEGAPIGHGVPQYFGSAETVEGALLDESTTGITIEEGVSLDGYNGVDSVAVEAPLGHGVTQWYAENADGPRPVFNEDITGQDGPSADPTNSNFKAQGYNDKMDESMGMRHRGSHSQSMKDRRDEASAMDKKGRRGRKYDDVRTMDAQGYNDKMDESMGMRHRGSHSQSMKSRRDEASAMDRKGRRGRKYDDVRTMDKEFNAIVSHRSKKGRFNGNQSVHSDSTGKFLRQGADTAGYLQDGALSMDGYTPLESVDVDRTSYQPTQNYGADQEVDMSFKESVKVGAGLSVGVAAGSILLGVAGMLGLGLLGGIMGKGE